jgi:cell fate regulator YaaT (PSP1 superfamily)
MVETENGLLLGRVVSLHDALPDGSVCSGMTILRTATDADRTAAEANDELSRRARRFCQESIRNRELDMKLVDVEVYFDASKIIFYFTAPARIDFRELLKDLVREYRSRIELRQIGVRHETQIIGAVGNCGMVCCCRRFLRKFAPVTIRMAKEQNLFLNPAKISGICGRLLCCLSYEQENYDAFHRECPRLGKKYQTSRGAMKVLRANMFRNSLSVLNENNEEQEVSLEEWRSLTPRRPEQAQQARTVPQESPKTEPGGFLVVSVSPESLNDPDLFSELLDDSFEDKLPVKQALAATQESPAQKPKRKRRPRQK